MRSCVVIYNPNSGHIFKDKYLKEYRDILIDNDYCPRFIATRYKGHAKEIINHLEKVDLVISMGGDGTFNEIVHGNLSRKEPLIISHIPVGTTNDIGTMFGYGKNVISNLKLLLKGSVEEMDMCLINDRPFVYVAGFGKFMRVPYATPRKLKKKYGYFAYIIEGVKDFFHPTKLYKIKYKVDNVEKVGYYSFVLITNATRIAGINNFYKDVYLDDDRFEVIFCNFRKRIDIVKTFSLLMTMDASRVSGVEFYKTNNLYLEFDEYQNKEWCIDGERLDRASLNYSISNINKVKVMMPSKNVKKIFKYR